MQRGFQLPLIIPVLYLFLVTLLVIVPLVTKPVESASGLVLAIGTALPYYVIVILWTNKPASLGREAGSNKRCVLGRVSFGVW